MFSLAQPLERLRAVGHFADVDAALLEAVADQRALQFVVVDDEHGQRDVGRQRA